MNHTVFDAMVTRALVTQTTLRDVRRLRSHIPLLISISRIARTTGETDRITRLTYKGQHVFTPRDLRR